MPAHAVVVPGRLPHHQEVRAAAAFLNYLLGDTVDIDPFGGETSLLRGRQPRIKLRPHGISPLGLQGPKLRLSLRGENLLARDARVGRRADQQCRDPTGTRQIGETTRRREQSACRRRVIKDRE